MDEKTLTLRYNGERLDDFEKLTQKMHSEEIKQVIIQATNHTKNKKVEDLDIITNVSEDACSMSAPKSILPGETAEIVITINAKKLWEDDTVEQFAISIKYTAVKYIEVR